MLNKAPNIWNLDHLVAYVNNRTSLTEVHGGTWVPARPLGLFSLKERFRLAWKTFKGEVDVVRWPGDQ